MTRRQAIITSIQALLCPKIAPSASPAVIGIDPAFGKAVPAIASVWQFSLVDGKTVGECLGTYEIPTDPSYNPWSIAAGNRFGKSQSTRQLMESLGKVSP